MQHRDNFDAFYSSSSSSSPRFCLKIDPNLQLNTLNMESDKKISESQTLLIWSNIPIPISTGTYAGNGLFNANHQFRSRQRDEKYNEKYEIIRLYCMQRRDSPLD